MTGWTGGQAAAEVRARVRELDDSRMRARARVSRDAMRGGDDGDDDARDGNRASTFSRVGRVRARDGGDARVSRLTEDDGHRNG